MVAVSNTSPIFNLACIERLNLLHQQFGEVWIPPAVDGELQRIPQDAVAKLVLDAKRSRWLKIRAASNAPLIRLLTVELHSGEAEAIALALEMNAERLLIDERDGRFESRPPRHSLATLGLVGVSGLREIEDRKLGPASVDPTSPVRPAHEQRQRQQHRDHHRRRPEADEERMRQERAYHR